MGDTVDQNISPDVTSEVANQVEGVNLDAASWVAVAVIGAGIVLFWSGIAAALTG
jgi:hypothetical protein